MHSETALGKLYIGYSKRFITVIVVKATPDDISFPARINVRNAPDIRRGQANQYKLATSTKLSPFFNIYFSSLSRF